MKSTLDKKIGGLIFAICATALAIIGFSSKVFGNISYFAPTAASATASSTVQYLVPSSTQGTSTPVVYDSYGIDGTNQNAGQRVDVTDSLALEEYVQASSTATVFKTIVEYSDGVPGVSCKTTPNACDWYENNLDTYAAGNIAIATPNTYSYTYASTSITQTSSPTSENRGFKLIGVKAPLRYVRAYVVISGANGAVYLKFVPKKQQQ